MPSAAFIEQLQRTRDPDGWLLLLKLEHPSISTVFVVNDTRDWTISGQTWVGLPFRFQLPQQTQGEAPRAQIALDNVGLGLAAALEQLTPGAALQATLALVSRKAPTTVEYSFTAPLSSVSVTVPSITATVGNDDAMRAPAVKLRYDPTTSPGLFAG